jgi:alkylation response protein AidB-like acyl-CoA dehydrogenase
MMFPLQAATEPGRRFVSMMEAHAVEFAPAAAELDRRGRFAADNVRALCASGALCAAVPGALGGLGIESLYDLGVGVSRLARGDASTAIASWMHLIATHMMASAHRSLLARGKAPAAQRLERILRGVAHEGQVIAVLASEAGTYVDHPQTRAVRDGDGYRIDGSKLFGTMAQAAKLLNVALQLDAEDGTRCLGYALVPRETPGVTVNDDWDALGMRASGSGSVTFNACRVPLDAVSVLGELGKESAAGLLLPLGRNVGLLGACIGIAEAAREQAIASANGRKKLPSKRSASARVLIQEQLGEIEVTLNAVRASFAHTSRAIDDAQARLRPRDVKLQDARELAAAVDSCKVFVERGCAQVVDRCLTVSGGSGYLSKSPLSRHYRDVRALPFMFPQSTETLQYIGMVALGLEPKLDL